MAALSWRSWVVHTSELCLVVVFGIPWPWVKKCYGMLWVTLKEYYWVWARLTEFTESTSMDFYDFLMDFGGFLMHEPSHFARCSPAWSSWMVPRSGDSVEKVLPPSSGVVWALENNHFDCLPMFTLWLWLTVCHGFSILPWLWLTVCHGFSMALIEIEWNRW